MELEVPAAAVHGGVVAESPRRARRRPRPTDELVPARDQGLFARSRHWIWFLAIGGLGAVTWTLVPTTAVTQLEVYDAVAVFAFAGFVVGAARNRGPARGAWRAAGAGVGLLVANELLRATDRLGGRHPFPAPADGLMIAGSLVLALALSAMARRHEAVSDRGNILDALTVTVALTALTWFTFVEPYASDPTLAMTSKLVVIARPFCWLLLVSLTLRLRFVVGRNNRAIDVLIVGLVVTVVADVALGVAGAARTYRAGNAIDVASLIGLVLLGAAALHSSSRIVRPAPPHPSGRIRLLSMLTITLASPIVLVAAGWSESRLTGVTLVAALCAVATFALVALRLWSLIVVERRTAALQGANRLGALVQNSKDAIFVVDVAGVISYVSPGIEPMMGCRMHELVDVSVGS